MTSRASKCASCGLRWKPGHVCPATDIDFGAAFAAYLDAFRCGDADAFMEMDADWSRWPVSTSEDAFALDRARGYADGFAQETARQQGAQS